MGDASGKKIRQSARPLIVDLDRTLLRSNLLLEIAVAHIRRRPLRVFKVLWWMVHDRAMLRDRLAGEADIDVTVLPYNAAVIGLIESQRSRGGRQIVLATASHDALSERIAKHLQLFDHVVATGSGRSRKRDHLVDRYGERGFDYVGKSGDDLPVWAAARQAYVTDPSPVVVRRAAAQGNVERVIRSNRAGAGDWAEALRLHQWIKNILIFMPLLASHRLADTTLVTQGLLAFLLFGMCASSVYLLNDMLDLEDDRHHPSKHHRPFASGRLSIKFGLIAFPILLATAFAGAFWLLPWQFTGALSIYYALALSYSLALKRYMTVDVIALAMLYTIRIIAGGAALALPLTSWLLAFSMFMFLSLALAKRYAELSQARQRGSTTKARGRDYDPNDLDIISSLGAASGYLSVMVLALYIQDAGTEALYAHPQIIWLACPILLFWVTRLWMLTHRGQMHEDPVIFAMRDRVSQISGVLFCLVFLAAI